VRSPSSIYAETGERRERLERTEQRIAGLVRFVADGDPRRRRAGSRATAARRLLCRRGQAVPARALFAPPRRLDGGNDEGPRLRRVSGPSCESPESGAFALVLQPKLRGEDLNLRPSGYEPDELPGCSTARHVQLPELRRKLVATLHKVKTIRPREDHAGNTCALARQRRRFAPSRDARPDSSGP
jgi:hypothetical protein